MTYYATRHEAFTREIVEALGEHAQSFDVDAIADEVIDRDEAGRWFCVCEPDEFWQCVSEHDTTA